MIRKLENFISGIPTVAPILRKLKFICWTRRYCKRYDISTLENYIKNKNLYTVPIDSASTSIVASLKFYPDFKQKVDEVEYPPIEVVELHDCKVIGESDMIIDSKGKAIYNANVGNNVNNSDPALQTGYSRYPTIGSSSYVKIFQYNKSVIPVAISLINTIPQNYFHFLHEVLSRFWVVGRLKLPDDVPFIVNARSFDIPQMKELFNFFNDGKRQIITVNHLEQVNVKKLFLIPPLKISGGMPRKWNEVSYKYPIYNLKTIDYLRAKLLGNIKAQYDKFPDKIFISRKNFNLRKYNEAELEQILHEHGFATVYPEELSIWEQIQLFSQSKIIVAASGAALANLLFCQKGTDIIVFLNKILSMPIYSTISYYLGCNLVYIAADKVKNKRDYHSAFHVNPDDLRSVLEQLESKTPFPKIR